MNRVVVASVLGLAIALTTAGYVVQTVPRAVGQIAITSPSTGPAGATGPTGPAGVNAIGNANARTCTAGTAIQAMDTTKPAFFSITITSTANFSLAGGTTNTAVVVSGTTSGIGTSGGTTEGTYSNSVTGTIAVGLNLNSVQTNTYVVALPAGQWFAYRVSAGSVTVVSCTDKSIG